MTLRLFPRLNFKMLKSFDEHFEASRVTEMEANKLFTNPVKFFSVDFFHCGSIFS